MKGIQVNRDSNKLINHKSFLDLLEYCFITTVDGVELKSDFQETISDFINSEIRRNLKEFAEKVRPKQFPGRMIEVDKVEDGKIVLDCEKEFCKKIDAALKEMGIL